MSLGRRSVEESWRTVENWNHTHGHPSRPQSRRAQRVCAPRRTAAQHRPGARLLPAARALRLRRAAQRPRRRCAALERRIRQGAPPQRRRARHAASALHAAGPARTVRSAALGRRPAAMGHLGDGGAALRPCPSTRADDARGGAPVMRGALLVAWLCTSPPQLEVSSHKPALGAPHRQRCPPGGRRMQFTARGSVAAPRGWGRRARCQVRPRPRAAAPRGAPVPLFPCAQRSEGLLRGASLVARAGTVRE